MGTFKVDFANYSTTVRSVASATEAMRIAAERGQEEGIDSHPISAQQMREAYIGGGYCLIPVSDPVKAA